MESPAETPSPDSLIEQLQQSLSTRVRDLERRENDVTRREKAIKEVYNGAELNDVIHLNVGGRTGICALRRTLTSVDGSMLAVKFSGRWDERLEKDRDGNVFIDQDPETFLQVLSYLRDKNNHTPFTASVRNPPPSADVDRLLEHYDLTLGVYPFAVERMGRTVTSHINVSANEPSDFPSHSFSAQTMKTFYITSHGHNRRIVEFEIASTDFTWLQVGWQYVGRGVTNSFDKSKGVGYYAGSVALDVAKQGYFSAGGAKGGSAIRPTSGDDGAVIRCTFDYSTGNFGWFVAGEKEKVLEGYSNSFTWVPCVSVAGNVRVSDVKYEKIKEI